MSHFVYVIKSEQTGRLYKGMTESIPIRLAAHNAGKVRSTKAYLPWILVYKEEFPPLMKPGKENSSSKVVTVEHS